MIFVVLIRAKMSGALSGQSVLLGRNCEKAAKMTLWLC